MGAGHDAEEAWANSLNSGYYIVGKKGNTNVGTEQKLVSDHSDR